MKKKIAGLLVASMSVMLFGGCSNAGANASETDAKKNETSQSTGAEKTQGEVTLTIAARGGTHVDVINAVKDEFEKKNNCKIEVLGLESDDLKQKISLDAANKEGTYDIVMIDDPWITEFCENGILLNLTENGYTDDSDFVTKSLDVGKYPYAEGDTFALPFAGNVTMLFYNEDVLSAINEEVPSSWESVYNVAKKAKEAGYLGYVVRGQQGNPIVGDYLPLLWAYGGNIFDKDMNCTVDSDEAKQALEMYIKLANTGANYEKDDIVSSVSDAKAAMSLGWPSWYISNGESKSGYAAIPNKASDSSKAYSAGVIGNWLMGVTANSKNIDLSIKLLEYLTSADTQITAADAGAVPTRTSVFDNEELVAKYPYYTTLKEATEQSAVRPRTPLWSEVEQAYGIELSNALSETKTVDDALKDAKTAIEKIMK